MYVCTYVRTGLITVDNFFENPARCMYVCTYVRTYVCMYVCTYVHTYVCMYVCMYVRTYVRTYVCMYVCMYVLVSTTRVQIITNSEDNFHADSRNVSHNQ